MMRPESLYEKTRSVAWNISSDYTSFVGSKTSLEFLTLQCTHIQLLNSPSSDILIDIEVLC